MLKDLFELSCVSGKEDSVREYLLSSVNQEDIKSKTDPLGNLFLYSSDDASTIIAAPMDEAGFIVTDITDDGYLRFDIIGKIKSECLLSKAVLIGDTFGVIAAKAVHLTSKKEREKPIEQTKLYIDIGANSKQEAKMHVLPGDLGTFVSRFFETEDGCLCGKGISRAACGVLMDLINDGEFKNCTAVFTTMSNTANRGLKAAIRSLENPKLFIYIQCVDVLKYASAKIKNRAIIGVSENASKDEIELAKTISNEICVKSTVYKRGALEIVKEANPNTLCFYIMIPCENSGTDVEIVNQSDIASAKEITEFLVKKGEEAYGN